jgi:methylenetetrahydrofolate dehydrogenase (NADP+)/methenyltetrahydrofolate cyclohydrolase
MPAVVIDGAAISAAILDEIRLEVEELRRKGRVPGLATILVGANPASLSYVALKVKTALGLGFHEVQENLDAKTSEQELLDLVRRYNRDPQIHGILVQLPLPKHIDEKKVIYAIDPEKDVDGFHPVNIGRLILGGDEVRFPPCTPAGILELILRSGVNTDGAEVVVVGRSNIVGKPIANMLMQKGRGANATVTVAHTGTRDLAGHCRRADILIVAAGSPGLVRPEWIKPGACVIDVGVNRVGEKTSARTGRPVAVLRGDVDYEAASRIAGWITPVPGGVGPMTIAMLMKNTLAACRAHTGVQTRSESNGKT